MTSRVALCPDPIITAITLSKMSSSKMSSPKPSSSKDPTVARAETISEQEKRQQRLAEALRANLHRRKAQKRGRADTKSTDANNTKPTKKGADHG